MQQHLRYLVACPSASGWSPLPACAPAAAQHIRAARGTGQHTPFGLANKLLPACMSTDDVKSANHSARQTLSDGSPMSLHAEPTNLRHAQKLAVLARPTPWRMSCKLCVSGKTCISCKPCMRHHSPAQGLLPMLQRTWWAQCQVPRN
jgi:hypothetical protein